MSKSRSKSTSNILNRFLNNKSTSSEEHNNSSALNAINSSANSSTSSASSTSEVAVPAAAATASYRRKFMINSAATSKNALNSISSLKTAALSLIKSQANLASNNQQSDSNQMSSTSSSRTTMATRDDGTSALGQFKVDKKLFEKLNKLSEKILKYCQSERMNLINSPPYIIDILPDICQLLNVIQATYESKLHVLSDIEYFNIFSCNLLEKLLKIVDLFKQAGKRIYEPRSDERTKLTKFTLVLSHSLAELKSLFPKDVYEGQQFRIAKQDASEFWKLNFGEKTIVTWHEFERKLNLVHKIANPMEAVKLRQTIQLCESRHVSIFEFDIFTRLFQPWDNLLNNWKFLATEHPAYSAFSTYDEIHRRLQKFIKKPGTYLYRLSCTKLGQWAIGYVTFDHKILQTIPQSLVQALIDGHKQNLYMYPNGEDTSIDISSAIAVTSARRVETSKEQQDMYLPFGTSFQICKICSENNKDRKLEPCGHLICSTCLESWQEVHSTPSCPFCRCEIKTFEPIIITPFRSNSPPPTTSKNAGLIQEEEKASTLNDISDEDGYIEPQPKNLHNNATKRLSNTSLATSSQVPLTDASKKFNFKTETISLGNTDDSNTSEESPTKANPVEMILSNAMNGANFTLKDQVCISRKSTASIQPPTFPPPNPPPNIPLKPAPPVPLNSQPSTLSQPLQLPAQNSIVREVPESSFSNLVTLKIENKTVVDRLVNNYGFNRTKVTCALIIANNDVKSALDILQKYKNIG